MNYKPYNKRALSFAINRRDSLGAETVVSPPAKKSTVSFWDISKWPERWESGAKELEKSSPGKLITAPIRLPEAVLSATMDTVKEVPKVVKSVSNVVPFVALAASLAGIGYIVYMVKKDGKKIHNVFSSSQRGNV